MEEIILNIIMHSGEARSYSMEAISLAKSGRFNEAKELIIKADEELGYAHNSQTNLIQGEAASDKIEFSLLLVHAEDHLMTTMTFKDLAVEIIEVHEKINSIQ
ncbi:MULTISPECIES: PTS lactose/cellobiose transporter subunit IIA [unclassified Clostridium]|uniref:PTS lactose/cellobiose transporter subunit IIA n=1 Tax=unclassified Clostridium TaxID=2614128 RepID=UPI00029822D7|nr:MULTISPECIES: PTS lactose/cellobiose transporter subunit IIA [unclassified Clostridium]EKQ50870.1 MAG: phosphotransferase system cellobiose-specific component IIA [Clostridium sp. Maddingley MBC34-26]